MTEARVSLVMTVLNETRSIAETLSTVGRQTLLPDELVVVDAGSTDGTVEVVWDLARSSPYPIVLHVAPGASISEGRNLAIAASTHELIAVTDAGVRLHDTWLAELVSTYASSTPTVVSGFFEPESDSWLGQTLGTTITPTVDEINPSTFLPSSRSMLFERAAWADVGGYPEWLDYCEDLVFDLALRDSGYRFAFSPRAVAAWDARDTWKGYFTQYYRYARGDGKADLWLRRHVLRYVAYICWLGSAFSERPLVRGAGLVSFGTYVLPKLKRTARHHGGLKSTPRLRMMTVPLVVVAGDVAKMCGYPVGVFWRVRRSGW